MLQPIEVIDQAIKAEHIIKGVATRLGKHKNTVYKMLSGPEHCRYTRFLQLFFAIDAENPAGADAIFEDFRARVITLRKQRGAPRGFKKEDWIAAIATVVKESGESIQAALVAGDPAKINEEIAQSIGAHRSLLELNVIRARNGAGHAS